MSKTLNIIYQSGCVACDRIEQSANDLASKYNLSVTRSDLYFLTNVPEKQPNGTYPSVPEYTPYFYLLDEQGNQIEGAEWGGIVDNIDKLETMITSNI